MPAPPLAVTMGEPAGIGGEIALKAWLARAPAPRAQKDRIGGRAGTPKEALPPFYLIDDPDRLAALARGLGWPVPVRAIAAAEEAGGVFAEALPVQPIGLPLRARPAHPDPADAPAILGAIARAVAAVRQGQAAAVVTNPIHKENLYRSGFRHPGHTEYLAELAGTGEVPVMMLASPALRVVPVTIHLPLRQAAESLSAAAIVHAGRVTAAALKRDFGIAAPRLAVAGLNPHAGEGGGLGSEDGAIIAPAIAELRAAGIDARGPLPADTMFHAEARRGYDAALCMYHDQALIPLKMIDFWGGVNVTLGLPFVRTSPDHGTALAIAGRGVARADSLIAALCLAAAMAARRRAAAPA
jgi:4-hydroxythreonine-4-phosphate dehydrogenase